MRRLWLRVLIGCAVLACAIVWWWVSRPGTPSRLTAFLPVKGVNAAAFIDDPADLTAALESRFSADETTFFAEDTIKALDFDPRDADTWDNTGLDEGAGVGVLLFSATGNAPIVLAEVDSEKRFFEWLRQTLGDGVAPRVEAAGDVRVLTLANTRLLLGRRGPYTAFMRGGDNRIEGFRAFLRGEGRLVTEGPLRAMFRTAATSPRMVAFAKTTELARVTGEAPAFVQQFLAAKAPMVSGFLDDVGGAVNILLTSAGRQSLRRLTAVRGTPPAFSRLMPKAGWSALRVSLDLGEIFKALPALKFFYGDALRQWAGWTYVEAAQRAHARIGGRLSGHIVIAFSNTSLADLLAQPDPTQAEWAVFAGIAPNEERPSLDGLDAPASYVDRIAVFASSREVLDRIITGRADGGPGPEAHRLLDADVLFGLTLTARELLDTLESAVPPGVFDLFKTSRLARQPHLSVGFALEPDGVVSRGDTSALIATAGLVSVIVYPDLVRRRRERWRREAQVFVDRIAQGAIQAWQRRVPNTTDGRAEPSTFPPNEPATPRDVDSDCGPFPVNPTQWDTPGWRALNFATFGTHRYRYAFTADAAGFTARAIGDLDCDGVTSTFETIGRVVGPPGAGEVIVTTTQVRPQE